MTTVYEKLFIDVETQLREICSKLLLIYSKKTEDLNFTDDAISLIKNIKFTGVSSQTGFNLIVQLINRIRCVNLEKQILFLRSIISFLESNFTERVNVIKNCINKNISLETSIEQRKKLELEFLESTLNDKRLNFFGPVPIINKIEEIHLKLAKDVKALTFTSLHSLKEDIFNLRIGFLNGEFASKVKQDLFSYFLYLFPTYEFSNIKFMICRLLLDSIPFRMHIIINSISERTVSNEMFNFSEQKIIEDLFVNDGFISSIREILA